MFFNFLVNVFKSNTVPNTMYGTAQPLVAKDMDNRLIS